MLQSLHIAGNSLVSAALLLVAMPQGKVETAVILIFFVSLLYLSDRFRQRSGRCTHRRPRQPCLHVTGIFAQNSAEKLFRLIIGAAVCIMDRGSQKITFLAAAFAASRQQPCLYRPKRPTGGQNQPRQVRLEPFTQYFQ